MPSLAELQASAKAQGLSPYGSKAAVEARLNEAAAKELSAQESDSEAALVASEADTDAASTTPVMQASARMAFAPDGRNTPSGLVIPTEAESKVIVSAISSSEVSAGKISLETAQDHLADMKARYPQLNVRLDTNQECFVFEGGLQGRVTTTMHQPLKALIHNVSGIAPGYITAHQAARMAKGETGDLLGRSAVYE